MDAMGAVDAAEAEAEAMLLTLGGPYLEWRDNKFLSASTAPNGNHYTIKCYKTRRGSVFTIQWYSQQDYQFRKCYQNGEQRFKQFTDMGTAKAACERHFATGK